MEDSRRMILGFLLIFIIMLLFQFYAGSRNKNAEPEETTEQITTEDTLEKEIIKEKENLTGLFAEKEKNEEKEEEDSAEVFKVSTKSMDVYLSSKGGVIDSVYLKDYKVTFFAIDRNEPLLSTSIITSRKTVSTEPIDFKARVEDKNSEKRVIFSYMLDSVEMKKIYTFPDSSYLINVECSPQAEYLYDIGVFDTGEEFSRESYYSGAVYYAGGKSYTVKKGDLFKGSNEDVSGAIQWVGYKTKYFLSGVVPEDYLEDFILEKSPDQPRVSVRAESYARLYFGPLKFS
ncbi:MAG: membrane protein insertase YidC, partial [candidate division WOR-3 bacterium]